MVLLSTIISIVVLAAVAVAVFTLQHQMVVEGIQTRTPVHPDRDRGVRGRRGEGPSSGRRPERDGASHRFVKRDGSRSVHDPQGGGPVAGRRPARDVPAHRS